MGNRMPSTLMMSKSSAFGWSLHLAPDNKEIRPDHLSTPSRSKILRMYMEEVGQHDVRR